MKANELMIGDWVTVIADDKLFPSKYVGKSIPCKVEGFSYEPIVQPSYTEKGISIYLKPQIGLMVRVANNFGYMYFEVGRLSPITLTPEILEKNFPIANGCEYRDDNNGVCIEVYFNAKTVKYKKYAILYTDRGKIYIDKYVHQLQHALRLCGINKEITL